jgi:hypothetical protein
MAPPLLVHIPFSQARSHLMLGHFTLRKIQNLKIAQSPTSAIGF